jgi:hypothetical protein
MKKTELLDIVLRLQTIGVQASDAAGKDGTSVSINSKWLTRVGKELKAFSKDLGLIIASQEEVVIENDSDNREED